MPSEKILEKKKEQVVALTERLNSSCAGVLVDYKGINVEDDTKLRTELRKEGIEYSVVKNTLLHLAAEGAGLSELDSVLSGTTALATSKEDYVSSARILCKFAESHPSFTVKSGFMDGAVIDVDKINSIAKLPSKEGLLSMVCNVFNAPIASFARVIQAIVDKQPEAEAAPVEA